MVMQPTNQPTNEPANQLTNKLTGLFACWKLVFSQIFKSQYYLIKCHLHFIWTQRQLHVTTKHDFLDILSSEYCFLELLFK